MDREHAAVRRSAVSFLPAPTALARSISPHRAVVLLNLKGMVPLGMTTIGTGECSPGLLRGYLCGPIGLLERWNVVEPHRQTPLVEPATRWLAVGSEVDWGGAGSARNSSFPRV